MKLLKRSVITLVATLFISMFMAFPIFPAAATQLPLPTLEAIPTVITIPGAGTIVNIEIWARNVAEEWEIVGFQFSVPFNTQWLTPELRLKGDFMEAFTNDGEQTIYILASDIPYQPNWNVTKAMVMILPDSSGAFHAPFPGADGITEGRLMTLRYKGTGQGVDESMNIAIIDIKILLARDLNVELSGWKFKVNGKTGIGLGHKSTVGEVNIFEVQVTNNGATDAYVQATFDIVSKMAAESVSSDIAYLPVGQSTVLNATWTASVPGHYEIIGIVSYPPFTILYPLPSTRTDTLRLDVKPH